MTRQTAAPAMTMLVEALHPDAPSVAVNVVVRPRVAKAVVDRAGTGRGGKTGVPRVGCLEEVTGALRIEVLEAGQIAMTSGADRCSPRRSRGCQSRLSPVM
jgi:hypothetical protein